MENAIIAAWIIAVLLLLKTLVTFINAKLDKKKRSKGFLLCILIVVVMGLTGGIFYQGLEGKLASGLKTGFDAIKIGINEAYSNIKSGNFNLKDNLNIFSDEIENTVEKEETIEKEEKYLGIVPEHAKSLEEIPVFTDKPFVIINDNKPLFTEEDKKKDPFESYSELDSLGRCGVCMANVSKELMPTTEREYIGMIKPSGWKISKYDFIDGQYLYNRCHLIAYMLTGENANEKNLITGTRYLNTEGMLPFENMVAEYVRTKKGHVLYRVTPIFEGDNPLAKGVQMEGYSIEDEGQSIEFNVFCYNAYPGIEIDYKTSENHLK